MDHSTLLRMENITKYFPGVVALQSVSFDLNHGEIHALIGENGAGKSTLMKILGGVYAPDSGKIFLDGKTMHFSSPGDSIKNGISAIYQEFNLVPTLSVADNIFLGKELVKRNKIVADRKTMNSEASSVISKLGLSNLDSSRLVRELSVAQQQLVEIGKALYNKARILVMDEPTAVLSPTETRLLFDLITELRNEGLSIIYISHRLPEVLKIADRITILRDGTYITTMNNSVKTVTEEDLIKKMVGRDLENIYPDRHDVTFGETILEVRGLAKNGMFRNITFSLHKSEILGFSGLIGSGRTEIMKAIFGCYPVDAGEILVQGIPVKIKSIPDAINQGIALVPEDRKREALVLVLSLAQNVILAGVHHVQRFGILIKKLITNIISKYINDLGIRPPLPNRKIKDFSGGNQQKAVIAKWLANNPKIIILDEPTRGIDVGAKVEIYKLIDQLARSGLGVIFISSEQLEIIGMCDKVIVLHNGTISGEFDRREVNEERLMSAAAGLTLR